MGFRDRVEQRVEEAKVAQETGEPLQPVPVFAGQRWQYETEVLTSVMGRDKLRTGDLDTALKRRGDQGWELVSCNLDADLKGSRDGHLLIFKRLVS
jgi:hypothetical protein